jgi:hypothetical protein
MQLGPGFLIIISAGMQDISRACFTMATHV